MECPTWFDTHTRGCPHPNGVFIAGSTQRKEHGMKVELLDLSRKGTKHLPNLGFPVTDVGMTYDVGPGVLTVAGGDQYDNEGENQVLSGNVFQLSVPRGGVVSPTWEKLISLEHKVSNPMLVNDNEYLYVLGGDNEVTCVRMAKADKMQGWRKIKDLPKKVGVPIDYYQYSGGMYSGALFYRGQVRVLTRTECWTYDNTNDKWDKQPYSGGAKIKYLTPIIHNNVIMVSMEREHQPITIECLEIESGAWHKVAYYAKESTPPANSRVGAGKFTSAEFVTYSG